MLVFSAFVLEIGFLWTGTLRVGSLGFWSSGVSGFGV